MAVFSVPDAVRHDYKDKVKMSQTKKCGGDKIDLDEDDDVAVGESIRSKGEAPGRCGPSAPRLLESPAKAVLIGGPAPAETMVAAMVAVEILHVGPDCTCYAFLFLYKLVEAGDTEKLR